MAFSGSPKTEDKAQLSLLQAGLIGRGNDAGVEKGAGFKGVLVHEIGTEENPSGFAQLAVGGQKRADLVKAAQKDFADPLMTVREFPHNLAQFPFHVRLFQKHDPREKVGDALVGLGRGQGLDDERGKKGAQQHAPGVGTQLEREAANPGLRKTHDKEEDSPPKLAVALCRDFISARESRKARVDSAP
jgi:hypothetical protein